MNIKRSVRNCGCDKNEIAKQCWDADHNFNWDQKKVIDRESRLIPWKIKETIHSLKNPNHINKISYMLPEIWPPNLRTNEYPRVAMVGLYQALHRMYDSIK